MQNLQSLLKYLYYPLYYRKLKQIIGKAKFTIGSTNTAVK